MRAPGFYLAPRPNPYRDAFGRSEEEAWLNSDLYINALQNQINNETTGNIAAIVLEPIQGWGGSVVPPDDFLPKLRELCTKNNILLFCDEVLTCMARTGKMFASDHWGVTPDIMTLGKGFGNGFPVTAMCVSEELAPASRAHLGFLLLRRKPDGLRAALASIEVIEEEGLCERSAHLGELFLRRMNEMKERHPIIGDARGKGCLLALEIVKDRETKEPFPDAGKMIYQKAFSKGLGMGSVGSHSPSVASDDSR